MTYTDKVFAESWSKADGWFIPRGSLSEPAAEHLDELLRRAAHGGSADVILRVDAKETRWQADWVKYMRRAPKTP